MYSGLSSANVESGGGVGYVLYPEDKRSCAALIDCGSSEIDPERNPP